MISEEKIGRFWECRKHVKLGAQNYLFLDYNGVIDVPGKRSKKPYIERVNKLAEEFDMQLVVTSSERAYMNGFEMILREAGLSDKVMIAGGTEINDLTRTEQIVDWVLSYDVGAMYILDDASLSCPLDDLYFGQAYCYTGLTESLLQKAEENIRKQLKMIDEQVTVSEDISL